jgi:HlyD family type I secretion membrane fusion protein
MSEENIHKIDETSIVNSQPSIEVRSDEVQEIMSHVPNWMIRWGISLIFVLIVMFLFLSWIIKYPDVIKGTVELTTVEPPIKLVSKNSGEIENIYFTENSDVKKGDVIVTLNNLLTLEAKNKLEIITKEIQQHLSENTLTEYQIVDSSISFGAIQNDYSSLIKSISEYQNLVNENNIAFNIKNLKEQIKNNTILRSVTYQQLNTSKTQLKNAEDKYNSDQSLYKKGVISKMQFYEEEKKYINAKNEVENLKKSAVQNSITITDLEKQLNELEFDYNQKQKTLLQDIKNSLSLINNAVANWDMNYQIKAPINGKLTYIQQLNKNQFIESGKELFAVVPDNQKYIGYVKIPKQGYGKVLKGQKVRMKFDNFPFQEYGQLNGVVSDISLIPNEDKYLIKVQLTNGLMSSYKKELVFTPEMSGAAEIITEDLRLLDRIFNKFRKIFDN